MEGFISSFRPFALQAAEQTGLDPRLILAQAALETGWGKSAPGNNYFGIKSHGKPGGQTLRTTENVGGQNVSVNDSFRKYGGMGDSVSGYVNFLQSNPRYKPLLGAKDLESQIDALQASGYATDPQYGNKLRSIIGRIDSGYDPVNNRINNAFQDANPMQRYTDFSNPPGLAAAPRKQGGAGNFIANNRDFLRGLGLELLARGLDTRNRFTGIGAMAGSRSDEARRQAAQQQQQQLAQQAQETQRFNATAAFLEKIDPQAAELMRAGQLPAKDALAIIKAAQPEPGYSMLSDEEEQAMGLDPKNVYQRGPKGNVSQVGGSNVTVNLPEGPQRSGDYIMVPDPQSETGYRMDVIPGSKTWEERQAKAKEAATAESQAAIGQRSREATANIVTQDIDRALTKIEDSPGWTTGPGGALLQGVPGSQARDVAGLLATVKANAGFDRLQAMRDASPTGGALGQVSEREMQFLQAAIGNLEQSQSKEQLVTNLKRVRQIYDEIINGPQGSGNAPATIAPGTVEDGYRFKGGDPADPNNWEKM